MKKQDEMLVFIQEVTNDGQQYGIEILEENTKTSTGGKKGGVRFKAVLQEVNHKNQNGRIYRKSALSEGLQNINDRIKKGIFFCEMDHPTDSSNNPLRFSTVLLKNSSHRILDYRWNGDLLEATCQTTSNSVGKDLKALIAEDGIPVGFSLRGAGRTKVNKSLGLTEVVDNMKLFSWDAVSNPSHKVALTQRLIESEDLSLMLMDSSERVKMLSESVGLDLVELKEDNGSMKYDIKNNMVVICKDTTCLKATLEETVRMEYMNAFKNLLG